MARNGKRRLLAEMNVVPYIDVMLVLVVILMVAASSSWSESLMSVVSG